MAHGELHHSVTVRDPTRERLDQVYGMGGMRFGLIHASSWCLLMVAVPSHPLHLRPELAQLNCECRHHRGLLWRHVPEPHVLCHRCPGDERQQQQQRRQCACASRPEEAAVAPSASWSSSSSSTASSASFSGSLRK
uniref:Uncharacterized protein n=1 Tax=Oryza sativa subsp. japonica TaxID=39947 RepID=Q5ZAQ0_ORYSJ|nr:hypothetical protein [Oryza sativa Japonica Group]BAD53341.1 hypothetical protein [Oryza sativa Japonica Group]